MHKMEVYYNLADTMNNLLPSKDEMLSSFTCDKLPNDIMYVFNKSIVALFERNYKKSLSYSQVLIDKSWEHLNSGHWKDVPVEWRKMYSFGCVLKVASTIYSNINLTLKEVKEIIKVCDMGLLLGINIMNKLFHKIISALISKIKQNTSNFKDSNYAPESKKFKITSSETLKFSSIKISELVTPSISAFKTKCVDTETPAILKSCIDHWPARTYNKWNFEYLEKIAGFRLVPVEIGSKYTDENWGQKLITISEFISSYINVTDENGLVGYLAQHQLFDQIEQLQNDIVIPDYCCLSDDQDFDIETDVEINAWFGPKNTVSPCHYDNKRNLLVQVVGSKFVKLYPKSCTENLYPHEGMLTNTSQVNVENPDIDNFPSFKSAEQHCMSFVLNAGDMLYIPPKYWHYIRSLEPSMSVSFWWQ